MPMITSAKRRADAAYEDCLGADGQGRGRFRFAALPNEAEHASEFNDLAIRDSKRTRVCVSPGRSP
jgi:hypothetical protein